MIRRLLCWLLIMSLFMGCACAEISFPHDTRSQQLLADYMDRVNADLMAIRARIFNSMFLCFPTMATLGVTDQDDAQVPQTVELQVTMTRDDLIMLVLRVQQPDQFAQLAAACIHAAAPDSITWSDALKAAKVYSDRVKKTPNRSFTDTVNEQQGETVRFYFAYEIEPYEKDVNWLQLTLIFPMAGYGSSMISTTPVPEVTPVPTQEYAGIRTEDQFSHFEIFATPTPQPDSPAAESAY